MKKILILNRKFKENENIILLTDSTPYNYRSDGKKLEGTWMNCDIIKKGNHGNS